MSVLSQNKRLRFVSNMVAVAEARRSGRQEVFNMSVETVQTHVWVTKGVEFRR